MQVAAILRAKGNTVARESSEISVADDINILK